MTRTSESPEFPGRVKDQESAYDMKTLYLHIGCHKTATSSIQKALFNEHELLSSAGISLFAERANGKINPEGNTSSWVKKDRYKMSKGYGGEIENADSLAEKLAELPGNVIMSAEALSWLFTELEIAKLAERFKKLFDEIRVILYIRRQDKLIISHHQQASKNVNFSDSMFYSTSPKAIPEYQPFFDKYFNYYDRVSLWSGLFGNENIVIRVFEEPILYKGDPVLDFFKLLGITSDIQTTKANISNGFESVKVGHLLNQCLPQKAVSRLVRRETDNSGKMLPSRQETQDFYARFVESNKMLNNEYQVSTEHEDIFGKDFSEYTEKPQDLWSEESANQAISNILKSMEPFADLDVDEIRIMAISLEKTNIEAALKLMETAHKLRPRGGNIIKKLEEYRRRIAED